MISTDQRARRWPSARPHTAEARTVVDQPCFFRRLSEISPQVQRSSASSTPTRAIPIIAPQASHANSFRNTLHASVTGSKSSFEKLSAHPFDCIL